MDVRSSIKLMLGVMAVSFVVIFLDATYAFAIATPAPDALAFGIYDIVVNGIVKGPIGFVAGLLAVCFAAYLATQVQIMPAIGAVIGGAVILSADDITRSLGAVII